MPRLILSNENALEMRLVSRLKDARLKSHHNSDVVNKGIPDRYVYGCNGAWIECKVAATRAGLAKGFQRQASFMDRLTDAGDRVFVCGLTKDEFYLEPWDNFKSGNSRPWGVANFADIDDAFKEFIENVL